MAARLAGAAAAFSDSSLARLLWGLAMGGSALVPLVLAEWETPDSIRSVVVLFALGGAIAFPFGLFLARFLSTAGRRETAFAAMLLSLAIATIAVTAGLFALHYRSYYAEWHAEAFSSDLEPPIRIHCACRALSVRGSWAAAVFSARIRRLAGRIRLVCTPRALSIAAASVRERHRFFQTGNAST